MSHEELEKVKLIKKQEKELSIAIHVLSWIFGIAAGLLISYILYTL